jgi:phage-related protein
MINNEVIINGTQLHKLGTIESIEYSKLSNDILYSEIANRQPRVQGRKRQLKEVTLKIRIHDKLSRAETKKQIDEIVGLSFSDSPISLIENGKYCRAILAEAEDEYVFKNGLLSLTFVNLDGLWYGEEKNGKLTIDNQGIISTDFASISIVPSALNVTLKDGKGHALKMNALNTRSAIIIDLENKTATQNGKHVELSTDSRFFSFEKGKTVMLVTNGATNTIYREVIAL